MKARTIEEDLRVLHRRENISPSEAFVVSGIRISLQASGKKSALFTVDEMRLGGPVGDIKIGCSGQDDGQEAFDDEDPALAMRLARRSSVHVHASSYPALIAPHT